MTIAICMLVTTLGGTWNNKKFLQIKKKEKFSTKERQLLDWKVSSFKTLIMLMFSNLG